ncbi:hypothetical protein A2U01_0076094, partial [Trifolium medium]|nr:hypothetical protein [Trifolium medium]
IQEKVKNFEVLGLLNCAWRKGSGVWRRILRKEWRRFCWLRAAQSEWRAVPYCGNKLVKASVVGAASADASREVAKRLVKE